MSERRAQPASIDIVGAARSQVAEEGLRGLSVRKVAARAGNSRGGVVSQTGHKAALVANLISDALAFQRGRHERWLELTASLDLSSANVLAAVISAFMDEAVAYGRAQSLVLCELVAEAARKQERHPSLAELVRAEEAFWRDLQRGAPHAEILGWAIANYCRDEMPCALALQGNAEYRLLRSATIARLVQRFAPMEGRDFATGFDRFAALSDPEDPLPGQTGTQRSQEIGRAIADLIQREGVAGVTHRSVAARAGIPKSSIAHHFRTREDLLKAGLAEIYRQLTVADHLLFRESGALPNMTLSTASHAIAIEATRDPAFFHSALNLRKMRGAFITDELADMLGPARRDVGALQAASMIIVGAGLALHLAGGEVTRPMLLLDALIAEDRPSR